MKKFLIPLLILTLFSCRREDKKTYLKDLAAFPVGTAVSYKWLEKDSLATEIVKNEFNSITPENDMKMHRIHPREEQYDWERAERYVSFANRNDMRVHGHTLIWHSATPGWVYEYQGDTLKLEEVLKDHIQSVVSHFGGQVEAWDVVNEALSDSGGVYRPTIWQRTLGDDYVAKAFEYAHKADSTILLFYNDYSLEKDSVKLYACLAMIDSFRARGTPIDGIGIQMHIYEDAPSLEKIKRAFREFAQRDMLIHVSELDVSFNHFHEKVRFREINDSLLLEQKRRYYDVVKAYRETVPDTLQYGITSWGFSDKYSWIPDFFDQPDWPCIYNRKLERKPAWRGYALALE